MRTHRPLGDPMMALVRYLSVRLFSFSGRSVPSPPLEPRNDRREAVDWVQYVALGNFA